MTKLFLVVAASFAALAALTGCAGLNPGVAAVVGSDTISHQSVDDVALALCSANLGGAKARGEAPPELATRGARQGALQVLLESDLSRQFGEKEGVTPNAQQVSAALAQNEQGIAMLPKSRRADFRAALKEYAEGQLILIDIGRSSLESLGNTSVSDDQAIAEGNRLRAQYVKTIDVEVDPRYGTFGKGALQPGGGSLSVAESAGARAGDSSDPSASWVATLPASQKCS